VAWAFQEKGIHPWQRYFPLEDIVEIYKLYNNTQFPAGFPDVTLASLKECKELFDLGAWAEITFGPEVFNFYARSVPFLGARYLDLPIGGVDDMAVWASFEFERIAHWLDVGAPPNAGPRASASSAASAASPASAAAPGAASSGSTTVEVAVVESTAVGRAAAGQTPADNGAAEQWVRRFFRQLRETPGLVARGRELQALTAARRQLRFVDPQQPQLGVRFQTAVGSQVEEGGGGEEEGGLGEATKAAMHGVLRALLRAVKVLGPEEDLPIHAPAPASSSASSTSSEGTAATTATTATAAAAAAAAVHEPKPARTVFGDSALGYLGSSLAAGDFDGDGAPDLATGAYGKGAMGQPQIGSVSVEYSGPAGDRPLRAPGGAVHGRFGWSTAVLDFNLDGVDDLAVSAPLASWSAGEHPVALNNTTPAPRNWGKVFIFFGAKGSGLSAAPNVTIDTRDEFTLLGDVLHAADLDGDGALDLLLGCPQSSFEPTAPGDGGNYIHRGAVMGFLSWDGAGQETAPMDARRSADFLLNGPADYGWFGQSLAVAEVPAAAGGSTRLLLVGSPGFRANGTVGRVYAYELQGGGASGHSQAAPAAAPLTQPGALRFTLTGEEHPAEFGWSLAVSSRDFLSGVSLLAAAAPAAGTNAATDLRAGEVRLLPLDAALLAQAAAAGGDLTTSQLKAGATLVGGWGGRVGSLAAFVAGGAGAVAGRVGGGNATDLLLGAPLESQLAHDTAGLLGPHDAGALYFCSRGALAKLATGGGEKVRLDSLLGVKGVTTFKGGRNRGRLGSAALVVAKQLVVGSPFADGGKGTPELSGAVDFFALP
jgi:hypothetical protein